MGGPRASILLVLLLISSSTVVWSSAASPEPVTTGDGPYAFGDLVDVTVPMDDGTLLHGSIYLPDMAPNERAPVVLELSPYFGVLGARDAHEFAEPVPAGEVHHHLLTRGYAIALFSLRGSGLSEGCLDVGGARDQSDAYELVQWLADQPWSNGNVTMTGYSYPGSTPWAAAVAAPPALKTIVPVAGISDWYSYMWRNGTPLPLSLVFEAYYPGVTQFAYAGGDPDRFAQALHSRACPHWVDRIAAGPRTYATGDHDAFWDERDYRSRLDQIEASVLLVHGLQDWNVKPDQAYLFNEVPTEKRLLLGQWGHGFPWQDHAAVDGVDPYPRVAYDQRVDVWLDHWLKGQPYPSDEPVVEVQAPDGSWRTPQAWPTPGGATVDYRLGGGGTLGASDEAVPAAPPRPFHTSKSFGPDPARGNDGTQLVFQSTPLEAPLHTEGEPVAHLTISVDRPDGLLVGHLFEIDPAGTWHWVDRAYLDLEHRNGNDEGEPMALLEPVELALAFYPQELLFDQGSRIGLVLATEDGEPRPHGKTRIQHHTTTVTLHQGELRFHPVP